MKRSFATTFLLAALAGCAVGPTYERPAVSTPTDWAAAQADSRWPAADWWTDFGDPQLDGLVTRALAYNHDLSAAAERVAQARALLQVAEAPLLPSLSGDAQAGRSKSASATNGSGTATNRFQIGLAAAFEPDLFGINRSQADAAATNLRASEFDRQAFALRLTAASVRAYFELSALNARLAITRGTLDAARNTLELVRKRERAGMASTLQLAQQESEIAAIEAGIPLLEAQRSRILHALALILGRLPGDAEIEPPLLAELQAPQTAAGLPSELLQRRPDVASAEAALASAGAEVRAATAALFPRIVLTAETGFASLALRQLVTPDSGFFGLVAGLSAPFFDGGRLRAQLQFSEARFRELGQHYQQAVLAAFAVVVGALVERESTTRTLAARGRAVEQAGRAYRVAKLQYEAGMADYLSVLVAERNVLATRDSEAQARLAALTAATNLYQALGGGWEECRGCR